MFRVLYGFIDSVEKKNYREGDEFVVGPKTTETRLRDLMGPRNGLRRPLIAEVADEAQEVDPAPELADKTVAELKTMAEEKGLEVKAKATKAELIAALQGE